MSFLTLWDIMLGSADRTKERRKRPPARKAPARPARVSNAQSRYDEVTRDALRQWNVRVRKWRSSMSGCAWEVHYQDGSVTRLIESPRPKGPMSAAIFFHEIGHHAIGFGKYSPRCLEEYLAWEWSLAEMERRGLNVTDRVRARMLESVEYAVYKAHKRRIKRLPTQVVAYLHGAGSTIVRQNPAALSHSDGVVPSASAMARSDSRLEVRPEADPVGARPGRTLLPPVRESCGVPQSRRAWQGNRRHRA